jgi:hypothetical protein
MQADKRMGVAPPASCVDVTKARGSFGALGALNAAIGTGSPT